MTAATIAAYPRIPSFPVDPSEGPRETGARAFLFLLTERIAAVHLDTITLDLAFAASQDYVTGPDTAPAARETFQSIRLDILQTVTRRKGEEAAAEQWRAFIAERSAQAPDDADDDHRDGGNRVPTHPTPPTAPAAPSMLPPGIRPF